MSVELTIETVEETIVLELQDHVPAVLTIDHIPDLRDELDSKVDKEAGLGLSELSFTTADKSSLDQSEQDRHTHNNKAVIDDLSDDSGVLQYKGLPISDQAALDAKVDKVTGKSLVDDTEIAKLLTVAHDATKNDTDAELRARATHTGEQAISTVTGLQGALDSKVDKESGKSLVADTEIVKLATVQENATANRDDELNADKVHGHTIEQVAGLDAALLSKFDKVDIVQTTGTATDKVMSQKAVTDLIMDMPSSYIPTPKPTPDSFGAPFEGGFYSGMIWNHIALSTENKTLAAGLIEFKIDRSAAVVYKGQSIEIRSIANPSNKFIGTVAGAYPRSITLNVTSISGSGTFSDWAVMSRFRVITAPKSQGESAPIALKFENTGMPTATQTLTEGWLSTNAMFAAGTALQYPAAHWARALVINGYSDWYIPARDELELAWRNLKPVTVDNHTGSRFNSSINYKQNGAYPDATTAHGINLNSSPQSPAYTLTDPAQTSSAAFRAGGSEEFAWSNYFWTSSEASDANVWAQNWNASSPGNQINSIKTPQRRVRAVRRSII